MESRKWWVGVWCLQTSTKNVYEVLGVYKKSGSKELFSGRKEMKGYFCLSQRTSERRLPSLQTQIWWRRVCLLSPCAHCWGCSALLTCTNAAYIKEISPPCMLACAACTAVSVCMHRSRVWGAEPALTAARRLRLSPSCCLWHLNWTLLWQLDLNYGAVASPPAFTLFICPETVCLKQVCFVPSGCWLYISQWE